MAGEAKVNFLVFSLDTVTGEEVTGSLAFFFSTNLNKQNKKT